MPGLIEEARRLAGLVEKQTEEKRIAEAEALKQWQIDHAADMVESLKRELTEHVMEAGKKGRYGTYLSVYAWSDRGCPEWVYLFRPPFEEYLTAEGFMFTYKDDADNSRDIDMPKNDSGGYTLDW